MNKSVGVVIPTTGNPVVYDAIESVVKQTYDNVKVYLVVDGAEYSDIFYKLKDHGRMVVYYLPENTGKNGQNGHRIFSAFSYLINTDYIMYLDQDCYFDSDHIESCINTINTKNLDWCYSLRKIVSKSGRYICDDNVESLGKYTPLFDYNLIDTNCFCLNVNIARLVSPYFVGGWGHDRRYTKVLLDNIKNFDCTGKYTVNYRLGGDNNLHSDFFVNNNKIVSAKYNNRYPWNNINN
jgi:hypothetical protein